MPDDENQDDQRYIFPPGLTDEQKDFVKQQYDRQAMAAEANSHRVERFFDELNLEQLQTFIHMMDIIEHVPSRGQYFEGIALATVKYRFNVCPGCGENHEEQVTAMAQRDLPDHPPEAFLPSQTEANRVMNEDVEIVLPDDVSSLEANAVEQFSDEPIVDGDRAASCPTCHGDHALRICNHRQGSHGQENMTCPEPVVVPCPQCRTPEWFTSPGLPASPCHPSPEEVLLPLEAFNTFVCSQCGRIQEGL